jgi:hypothetical protein
MIEHKVVIDKLSNRNTKDFNRKKAIEALSKLKALLSGDPNNNAVNSHIAELKVRLEILENSYSKLDIYKSVKHKMDFFRKVILENRKGNI